MLGCATNFMDHSSSDEDEAFGRVFSTEEEGEGVRGRSSVGLSGCCDEEICDRWLKREAPSVLEKGGESMGVWIGDWSSEQERTKVDTDVSGPMAKKKKERSCGFTVFTDGKMGEGSSFISHLTCRKKSERILLKTTFSKFTNEESNPLLIDIEDEDNEGNEIVQPRIRREGQKKCSTPKKKTKKQTGDVGERVNRTPAHSMRRDLKVVVLSSDSKKNMKPKVNVKKFDGGNSSYDYVVYLLAGLIESYDMTEDSGINMENELRTKRCFDRCKIKGDEFVVINSCSGKDNVTNKKLDEDEDSDFEDDKPVVTRKKRRHYTSFKNDDKENVKKFKRQRNKEGNVVKARKLPKVVASDAEEARRIQVRTSPNVLYSFMHNLSKEQEAYISSISLGHLLNMKVDGCASYIGHYIVRNLDTNRMVLKLHHGEIPINRQVIHEMLGLPLGHVTIKSMPYREVTDDTITVWRKQFEDEDNIRPRAVQQVIMQSTRADFIFKVNIFVLLCNTLGQSMSMGTCDLSMLSKSRKTWI
ncbi:unnamed protein product [Lactuca saligna]|uniref:Uncharacterized protein n=1 Tax=Lactuca saligna TaxID=75948 RepID=A0AA36ED97_LACSI|nr:unnamed protein product [Lactuca saligna]